MPPNGSQTTEGKCGFAGQSTIVTVWPHMHMFGTHMKVTYVGAAGSKVLHEATQWSMDTFDPIFGCLFGLTTGVIMAHTTVKILAMLYTTRHGLPDFLADSGLGVELLYFKTYHHVADFLTNFHLDAHSDILIGYSKLFGDNFLANTGSKIHTTDLFYVQYSFKW